MTDRPTSAHAYNTSHRLAEILLASLRDLAAAGHVESACRLAGRACAALREDSPVDWKAFNAFLHRFAGQTPDP